MTRQTLTAPLSRLFHTMGHATQTFSSRRDLAELDDRMLKDLGISRAQAEFEAARSLWHRPWHIGPHHDA